MTTKQLLYLYFEHRKKKKPQTDGLLFDTCMFMMDVCGVHGHYSGNVEIKEPTYEERKQEVESDIARWRYNSKLKRRKKIKPLIKEAKRLYHIRYSPILKIQMKHNRLVTLNDLAIRDAIITYQPNEA